MFTIDALTHKKAGIAQRKTGILKTHPLCDVDIGQPGFCQS